MNRLSIVKGNNRKENIKISIELIKKDIDKAIKSKNSKQLFIKINAIDTNFPLACTHIDALETVVEYFYDKFDKIIIGDNSFVFTKNKGMPYRKVSDKFPKIEFSDIAEFKSKDIKFKMLNRNSTNKISLLPKQAFTISLALPKTHDTFVYTGCLKNMFGCVIKGRGNLHALTLYQRLFINKYVKTNAIKWDNLSSVIEEAMPDLSILDAYEGMEGNGPLFGTSIKLGIAMCSANGIALDNIASKIFGFDYVPYLSKFPHNSKDIEIIKKGFYNIKEISKNFKRHYNHKYQITTKINHSIPIIDIRLAVSVLKRSYRLKDKLREYLKI